MTSTRILVTITGAALTLAALSCRMAALAPPTLPAEATLEAGSSLPDTTPPVAEPEPTERPAVTVNRIGIRLVDGAARFYDTGTGASFVPRGVNYVDFYPTERGGYENRVMATNTYSPDRVRAAFQHLADYGYNTIRIFFDHCGSGAYCIGNRVGGGLNPDYLDNMVDLMHIAAEEGIYLILTADALPEEGGYWPYFDTRFYVEEQPGFTNPNNADYLHELGVEIKQRFWQDLMSGLAERNAPFEVVLGWSLTNEYWLHKNEPPLSLDSGLAVTANGGTYDMADAEQKRQMVIDGTLYYIDVLAAIVREHDPHALITMGFYAPQFPNPTGIGGDTYVDTAPLLASAALDFWDFHAYYDADLTVRQQAENFGMIGYESKPVIMGETGAGPLFVPSAASALTGGVHWFAESCEVGFDGWLYWGYYPWPAGLGGAPWTPLEADELIFEGLSPLRHPDICVVPDLPVLNAAFRQAATASRQLADQPPSAAVDGGARAWNAGDYPPQWLEVALGEPTTIQRVGLVTEQWPPGQTRHQVWARLASGQMVLLADLTGYTEPEQILAADLPAPLAGVIAVRIETIDSPAWAAWREIEAITAPDSDPSACVVIASANVPLLAEPGVGSSVAGQLAAGQGALAIGSQTADDGSVWWSVPGGVWIGADGVTTAGSCAF